MICLIVTDEHRYTIEGLTPEAFGEAPVPVLPHVTTLSYDDLLARDTVPRGTYVFSDMERLSDPALVVAADLYRALGEAPGCQVLNDPAKVRFRYGLLRALNESGLNSFDAYRADGYPRPRRFPVFLRAETAHDQPLSALLPDQAALDAALAELERGGRPLRGLIVIEYAAEPVAEGVFRRYGTFRVGDRVLLDNVVTEDTWTVKHGKAGLATEEMYQEDERLIADNAYADMLGAAFALAGIDYGRADFGLVAGRPQIYEINTNPYIGPLKPHASETRMRTTAFARTRLVEALAAIDLPEDGPPVRLDSEALRAHRETRSGSLAARTRRALHEAEERIAELERALAAARAQQAPRASPLARLRAGGPLLEQARRLIRRDRT